MAVKKLTDKQELFCKEYLIDLNGTQAAIRAGYSENTAQEISSQNLSKLIIQKYIAELKAEREQKLEINAEWVLKQAIKVHNRCMEEKELLTEFDGKERVPLQNENGEYLYKFDSTGALKSLDLIGKHINIKAFDNKINIDGKIENEHTLTNNELSRKILHLLQKGQ